MISAKAKSALNRIRYALLPSARVGVCRIRHDKECKRIRGGGKFPYLSRFYDPNLKIPRGLPETVRYVGEKGNISLSHDWQEFFAEQNTDAAQKYLKRKQSGWVNYGPWPKVEQLGFGGDFVVVYKIDGDRAYIKSYINSAHPQTYTNEDYLQQFGVAYSDDSIGLPPVGKAFTFPISESYGTLWVHVDDLTFIRPVKSLI